MEAKKVLSLMDEIERTVYATQSWWPQLRRLLEQADASPICQECKGSGEVFVYTTRESQWKKCPHCDGIGIK